MSDEYTCLKVKTEGKTFFVTNMDCKQGQTTSDKMKENKQAQTLNALPPNINIQDKMEEEYGSIKLVNVGHPIIFDTKTLTDFQNHKPPPLAWELSARAGGTGGHMPYNGELGIFQDFGQKVYKYSGPQELSMDMGQLLDAATDNFYKYVVMYSLDAENKESLLGSKEFAGYNPIILYKDPNPNKIPGGQRRKLTKTQESATFTITINNKKRTYTRIVHKGAHGAKFNGSFQRLSGLRARKS